MGDLISRREAIAELEIMKEIIEQNGEDWLDDRDIPVIDIALNALREKDTLLFSKRLQIEEMFLDYCKKHYVDKNRPVSLLAFLQSKDWLNIDKILRDLNK